VEAIRVDDSTNYGFDKKFYWDRRNHTVTAPLDHAGHEIVGYLKVKVGDPDVHNPKDVFTTLELAQAALPKVKKKDWEVRQVIRKPLSGMPRAPREYRTVEDREGELIRIPER